MIAGGGGQRDRIGFVACGFGACMTVLFLLMLGRVVQLQISPGELLSAHITDRISASPHPGPRGDLLDRRGRILAATTFGHRVFVDPARFPSPPDGALAELADAIGMPVEEVAARVVPRIAENERRLLRAVERSGAGELLDAPAPVEDGPLGARARLIRYVSVGGVLEDWRVDLVRSLRIPGVHLETRSVRHQPAGELAASIVGKVGIDHDGLLGAELTLDGKVSPEPGRLRYVHDARGRPLWVEPDGFQPSRRGADVRLSIDLELQRIATDELRSGMEFADAAGGRVVVLDPHTGEILAMVDLLREVSDAVPFDWDNPPPRGSRGTRYIAIRPDERREIHPSLGRNRCVEDVYEPGSTFKPFMWAAVTELGLADPGEVINTEMGRWRTPYGRRLDDVVRRGTQTWAEVLINSSNIGMAKVTRRMSDRQMRSAVLRFGFGSRTGVALPGESPGIVTPERSWSKYTQTSVAMGYEVAVTPVQMVRAFAAFARRGEMAGTLPPLRLTAATPGEPETLALERVVPAEIAELTRETMRGVTRNLDQRLAQRDPGFADVRYEMFGKSGTAEIPIGPPPDGRPRPRGVDGYYRGQYNSSFIAGGPAEDPRLVVLVVIDDPGPERIRRREHYGSSVAGPVVRRIMDRSLEYLGVPPRAGVELAAGGR